MSRTRACLKNAFCFNMFSAYYNNNLNVSPSKNNSTESRILLEPIQIPPAINRISLPSQSTAPEESLASLQERLFACGKFLFTKETLDK